MENKYFTPDIEDIRVGFIAEWLQEIDTPSEYWELKTLQHYNLTSAARVLALNKKPMVRVPYLTKEQIEAEGWKVDYTLGDFDYYVKTVNNEEYELEFCYKERININIWKRTLYHGECKDINTFRKIIKLLGI